MLNTKTDVQKKNLDTVGSRVFEPLRETKIGSRNQGRSSKIEGSNKNRGFFLMYSSSIDADQVILRLSRSDMCPEEAKYPKE